MTKIQDLDKEIEHCGDKIKALKAKQTSKEEINALVEKLKDLRAEREKLTVKADQFDRSALESLLTKRFFFSPSFQIYGGVAGLFDYGPPGCALQNNLLSLWRQHFCLEENMLEIECTNLTPESVLKVSGHVDRFADWMVTDILTGDIFRADHLVKQVLKQRLQDDSNLRNGLDRKKHKIKGDLLSAECKQDYETVLETLDNYQGADLYKLIQRLDVRAPETGNSVTEPRLFNLMFDTQIGPTGQFRGFMRPETAQGQFLNFKRLLEFNNEQMPFASASIGKSFRNEISPRQGLLRVREFTMAEIEHFVDPLKKDHPKFKSVADLQVPLYSAERQLEASGVQVVRLGDAVANGTINNETLGYFLGRIYLFLVKLGIKKERLRFRQHMKNEMAHYACDCWDAEIESSYGWIECVGCADRSAYDLTAHSSATKEKLVARESLSEPIEKNIIELVTNQKKLGPAFKKDAALIKEQLDKWRLNDLEWNESQLLKIESELKNGEFNLEIDGKSFKLTNEMISIERRNVKIHVREFTPNVIEPSFGIGRILYSLIEHCYYTRPDDEQRAVLSFPALVAPNKVLLLPISRNEQMGSVLETIASELRKLGIANKTDDSGVSIGRRYARNDELGTPFAITVDFQTLKDSSVTLRERDSTLQIRSDIPTIVKVVNDLCHQRIDWETVRATYPNFVSQELE